MRKGLPESHERAWAAIAAPGTWLTGERRVAVAAEVRHARGCALCARLKAALSPSVPGEHDSPGKLSAAEVELVHRVASDPGRLTEGWARSVLARGLTEGEYIEIVGVISMVMMMDTFMRALGRPGRPLPEPQPGEPTRYRPPGAKRQAAWLALVEPEDAVPADGPMYPHPRVGYIYRALSLVPQAVRDYWALAFEHYLPSEFVYRFDQSIRAISRPQTEVLAARVSALHQCAY
jgi:alkylhydroperoxidase family enzyme